MSADLAAIVAALEAERLAPVPREAHVIGIEAPDLALLLRQVRPAALSGDAAAAYQRLAAVVRSHGALAATGPGGRP